MISSKFSINLNKGAVKGMEDDMKRALAISAGVLQDRIREAQVIPRDTGALQGEKFYIDDSRVNEGIVSLVNEGPYARRLYYHPEYNFRKDKNPFAQGLWFELWKAGGIYQNEPVDFFESTLKQILEGKL